MLYLAMLLALIIIVLIGVYFISGYVPTLFRPPAFRLVTIIVIIVLVLLDLFLFIFGIVDIINLSNPLSAFKGAMSELPFTEYMTTKDSKGDLNDGNKGYKNFNGGTNGLNLMLINNTKTNSYVGQYLRIAEGVQEGKADPQFKYHIPVEAILGTSYAEEGTYTGSSGAIPKSYLKWDNNTHSPEWNPADGISLFKAGNLKIQSLGIGLSPYWLPASQGSYFGPYQEVINTVAKYPNKEYQPGVGPTTNRTGAGEIQYMPDTQSTLDAIYNQALKLFPDPTSVNSKELIMCESFNFDPGGAYVSQELGLPNGFSGKEFQTSAYNMYKEMSGWGSQLKGKSSSITGLDPSTWKFGATILAIEHGWHYDTDNPCTGVVPWKQGHYPYVLDTNGSTTAAWLKILYPNQTMAQFSKMFMDSSVSSHDPLTYAGSPILTKVIDGRRHWVSVESIGHAFAEMYSGEVLYGKMLYYAGVKGVNPSDPASYMGSLETKDSNGKPDYNKPGGQGSGKIVPRGDNVPWWITRYNINTSELTPKRYIELSTAFSYLGWRYARLGPLGVQLAHKALDCSSLVEVSVETAEHTPFARNTVEQVHQENFPTLSSFSEMKPGDLIYFGVPSAPHHVAIYLSGTNWNNLTFINEPNPSGVCRVSTPLSHVYQGQHALEVNNHWWAVNHGTYTLKSVGPYFDNEPMN